MLGLIDTATVTISVTGIDLIALKKLVLVAYALAATLSGTAKREQALLAKTLEDHIRQLELRIGAGG